MSLLQDRIRYTTCNSLTDVPHLPLVTPFPRSFLTVYDAISSYSPLEVDLLSFTHHAHLCLCLSPRLGSMHYIVSGKSHLGVQRRNIGIYTFSWTWHQINT